MNQMLAKALLSSYDFECVIANHGKEALKILDEDTFNLILMDLMMPELDGFQTTMVIRKHPLTSTNSLPILALSADVTVNVR